MNFVIAPAANVNTTVIGDNHTGLQSDHFADRRHRKHLDIFRRDGDHRIRLILTNQWVAFARTSTTSSSTALSFSEKSIVVV